VTDEPIEESAGDVGVGPWPGPWPDDPRLDPALLRDGDRRNVLDRYRYWSVDAIVADLDARRHPLHIAIENWQHDLNIGSIVRTANAFNVGAVHIVGKRRWNRRGAMVTDRYVRIEHHPTVDDLVSWAHDERLPLLGIDNLPVAMPIETAELPQAAVMIFGQEGPGLTSAALDACDAHFSIAQFGSTRSINAAAAAAIAMHAWVRQHAVIG
jgi:tRNA G18 (ribose-2'-O)-methylase SpoU